MDLVARDARAALNELLAPFDIGIPRDSVIRPDAHVPKEFELRDFCRLCKWDGRDLSSLADWWVDSAFKGPTWDLLAQCEVDGRPGILLVEAKAHVNEVDNKPRRQSASTSEQANENASRIDRSLCEAELWWRERVTRDAVIFAESHYQLSNRLSAAVALANCGLDVVLMFLGFVQDTYFSDHIRDAEHWQATVESYVSRCIPGEVLEKRFAGDRGSVTIIAGALPVVEVSGLL